MTVLVIVLLVTNLVTLTLLLVHRRRSAATPDPEPGETFTAPRPPGVSAKSRRLITVEILNPMELVNNRGRLAGLAGSLVPGMARRVVYDQALKTLRRELEEKQVVADVRLHTLQPAPKPAPDPAPPIPRPGPDASVIDLEPVTWVRPTADSEPAEWVESIEDLSTDEASEPPQL